MWACPTLIENMLFYILTYFYRNCKYIFAIEIKVKLRIVIKII